MSELLTFTGQAPEVEVRSESEREVAIRIMKWGTVGRTAQGLETFEPGCFDGVDPRSVVLRMEHEGPPAGRGILFERTEEGQVGVFRVANTARGDELLTLAKDGYYSGASPSFHPVEGGSETRGRGAERVTVRRKVDLREVSLTWRPTYAGTGVLYARTNDEGGTEVSESTESDRTSGAPTTKLDPSAVVPIDQRLNAIEQRMMGQKEFQAMEQRLAERLEALQERAAGVPTGAEIPAPEVGVPYRGDWLQGALTVMDGGQLTRLQERALADLVTTANPGVVPPAYATDLIGAIIPRRRFMATTRQIDMPANGMQIIYPRIATRPAVGEQVTQKTEVTSTAVTTDTVTAAVKTYAGAGDISLQLLRRSDPSFLDFYMQLLAEAYARTVNLAAWASLFAATPAGGANFTVGTGAIALGTAFTNSVTATGEPPDTMWVSTQTLAAMINARDTSNSPLYTDIKGFGATAGANTLDFGTFMGLRLVWDPGLDAQTFDADPGAGVAPARVVVGPSRGFAWAEEGTFQLQADVPGRLGRDVALAGFVAFLPVYPAAFTAYGIV